MDPSGHFIYTLAAAYMLRAGAFRGLSGALPAAKSFGDQLLRGAAFGVVGGMTSVIGGGRFGHGFVSAGLGEGLGGALGDWLIARGLSKATARTLEAALLGGTSTEAWGGKFANGAASASLAHLSSNPRAPRQQKAGNTSRGGFVDGVLDIAGKFWALPNNLAELAYGGIGMLFGAMPVWDGQAGILRFTNMPE